jgi:hypothetical protein
MSQSFGPPPPVVELTMEQQFKLRRLQDLLPEARKEDIITIFMSLQHQNFVLANTVSNLVKQWPLPKVQLTTSVEEFRSGISSEIKD